MSNAPQKSPIPKKIQNRISREIHRAAAKDPNPVEALETVRREIVYQLAISPKMLRFWETNQTQPSVLQMAQIKAVMAEFGHAVEYHHLIEE